MKIKAVIFDMDGLMLDTEKLLVKYWCEAANSLGFPMERWHALALRSFSGKFAKPQLKEWFGESCDYLTIRNLRVKLMSEYTDKYGIEKKAGLDTLLDYPKNNGYRTAVATATNIERAQEYLKQIGVYDKFEQIICGNMLENGKPCPDIYLYACEKLGLSPSECMALEDSPNGVKSASSAGCVTVMVPDLTSPEKEQLDVVYGVAESLDKVIDILEGVKE